MIDDPTELIASEHADKPRFRALVASVGGVFVDAEGAYTRIRDGFDLDVATGAQLDDIGLWLGLSRRVKAPITDMFFTWGDALNPNKTGWAAGVWRGRYGNPDSIQALPDDMYRRILKAKAVANQGSGTVEGIKRIWAAYSNVSIEITDNLDMTMSARVLGSLSSLEQLMLSDEYIQIRPAGVKLQSLTFG